MSARSELTRRKLGRAGNLSLVPHGCLHLMTLATTYISGRVDPVIDAALLLLEAEAIILDWIQLRLYLIMNRKDYRNTSRSNSMAEQGKSNSNADKTSGCKTPI
jgi:hypothetical protein